MTDSKRKAAAPRPAPADHAALLREAEALCAKASPGPWQQTRDIKLGVKLWDAHGHPMFAVIAPVAHSRISDDDPIPQWQHDSDLARRSRELIPELISALQSLAAALREAEGDSERLRAEAIKWAAEAIKRRAELGIEPDPRISGLTRAELPVIYGRDPHIFDPPTPSDDPLFVVAAARLDAAFNRRRPRP